MKSIKKHYIRLRLYMVLMFEPEFYPLAMPVIGMVYDLLHYDFEGASIWANSVSTGYIEAQGVYKKYHK